MGLAVRDDVALGVDAALGEHVGYVLHQAEVAARIHEIEPVDVDGARNVPAAGCCDLLATVFLGRAAVPDQELWIIQLVENVLRLGNGRGIDAYVHR